MSGPAGTLALVLAETAVGGTALLYLTPLWSEVKRGFFKVTGTTLLLLGVATWGSVAASTGGEGPGRVALLLSAAFSATTLAWLVLLFARAPTAARVVGVASVPLGVFLLVALAGAGEPSFTVSLLQLLAGAAFLGAVWDGLLLGHWYLTDRGLTRAPINRFTTFLMVGVALEAAAVLLGGFEPTGGSASFNPLLTAAGLATWIALGMVAATALIAVMIRLTLRGPRSSAVQAATGFFYLAVITGFTGELAAKVRFLP
ncbi:MAG: hypothetical protein HY658_12050 [Actinobacteria bacterium]|nr:hypothetical protein [Actinomycetota bacterium]